MEVLTNDEELLRLRGPIYEFKNTIEHIPPFLFRRERGRLRYAGKFATQLGHKLCHFGSGITEYTIKDFRFYHPSGRLDHFDEGNIWRYSFYFITMAG
jgi:hypothetical protein